MFEAVTTRDGSQGLLPHALLRTRGREEDLAGPLSAKNLRIGSPCDGNSWEDVPYTDEELEEEEAVR